MKNQLSPTISITSLFFLLTAFTLFPSVAWASPGQDFASAVEKGPLYAAGIALLGGLLVSLTPCVYPMVAITVSVFGARKTTSKLQGFALSSAFVLGIVAMFTPLGVVAGMTGSLFGSALQSPWVLSTIALLFLAMSASMLGAFNVALPSGLTNRLAQMGGVGPRGAFGLGLACGLIAAPCTGPVLTGILAWIAKTQSAGLGALAMAAFSFGLGFPFLIVGTFAVQLPKSGAWMDKVKSILAIVLAVVAFYYLETAFGFLKNTIERTPTLMLSASLVALFGLAIGGVHKSFESPKTKDRVLKALGVASTTGGIVVLLLALLIPERELDWQTTSFQEAHQTAIAEKRPLLVDFGAEWCGACKELELHTFANSEVSREAGRFYALKIDATDDEDPAIEKLMSDLHVVGLPTVLLFDSTGKEVKRFTDFVGAEEFLGALQLVN